MRLPPEPGTYALVFRVESPLSVQAGRLGTRVLMPGVYVYVGSARGPGGLAARIRRHLRQNKRLHWHVDALTTRLTPAAVLWSTDPTLRECDWVAALLSRPEAHVPWPDFGSSDCRRCPSHLIWLPAAEQEVIREALKPATARPDAPPRPE